MHRSRSSIISPQFKQYSIVTTQLATVIAPFELLFSIHESQHQSI
jgi:hypothetical protein